MVIIGWRLQDVEEVFISLVKQTNKMGLEINKNKNTKFMIVLQKSYCENECVKLGTYNFEMWKTTYQGTVPTNRNELRPEIAKRITSANRAYFFLY